VIEREEQRLGLRVRNLREARGLSLKQLAKAAEVSESFVSQVERGVANPSVASLRRLAGALDASVGALFEGAASSNRLVKASERPKLVHPVRKWEDFLITPRGSRRLQVILSIIEPGGGSGEEAYAHDSDEECVVLLEGSLDFRVGDESYCLQKGDSLTFESRIPHSNRNPGPDRAEVLWIITPPSY
jgi:transcriptional regulator with XRE-family HTH domain